jgi:hypothetical protein
LEGRKGIEFSCFYNLKEITSLKLKGCFNPCWKGLYCENNRPSGGGSGLLIKNFKLDPENPFCKYGENLAYILTSNHYPILYVGASEGGLFGRKLKTGVFGTGGRLHTHIKKIFAMNQSINHTKGWRSHAKERYNDLKEKYKITEGKGLHDSAADDLFISIANCDSMHEFKSTDELGSGLKT